MDHKDAASWFFSSFSMILGMITLNNVAIIVGILSGVSVIASKVFDMWLKYKEYKRNINNVNGPR